MHESHVAFLVIAILELLLLASLAAVLLRRLRFPYTIGLMVIGILLAFVQDRLDVLESLRRIRLTPDVVLYLFLPTLVFPAAVQLDLRLLRQNVYPLVLFAFPGVIVSTAIVGSVVAALTPLSWSAALLFGALISATDPVAVVALFKDLRVPERLSVLVDGESLFNDATAIVLFLIILSAGASGGVGPLTVVRGAVDFVWVSVGGIGLGALIAALYGKVVRLAEHDPLVEIALSTVLAYTAFVVAHHYLHVSGILAVVGAGLVGGWLRRKHFEKATDTRAYVQHYWSYAVFVANSFVFLFLGIGEHTFLTRLRGEGATELPYIACAIVAVMVARLIVVGGVIGLVNTCSRIEPIDWRQQAIIFWGGGLRGALPLVLVLSLPFDFAERQRILDLTAGVVLFTLLVQGTTVSRLIRALGPTSGGKQISHP
jgi:CPA1 family monovalent cation:H+ antiporter